MSNILNAFGSDEIEGIAALIDKLDKSSFDYLKLESDGMSVIIGKNGIGEAVGADASRIPAQAITVLPRREQDDARALEPVFEAAPAQAAEAKKTGALIAEQEGVFIIRSPSYGIFYAQSEPGAPPYVTVGAAISADDTVGLMEIMKTFTAITSPVAGEVVAIHVKNEETLEPDQPLVSVRVRD